MKGNCHPLKFNRNNWNWNISPAPSSSRRLKFKWICAIGNPVSLLLFGELQLFFWGEKALFRSKSVRTRAGMRVCGLYVGDLYAVSAIRWHVKRSRKHKRGKRASASDKMLLGFIKKSPRLCQARCLPLNSDAESIQKESKQNTGQKRVNVNNISICTHTYPTQFLS